MRLRLLGLPVVAAALVGATALPSAGVAASTVTVKVADDVFKPKSKTVRRGTVVRFRWVGRAPHNVRVKRGPVKFTSKTMTKGSYRKRFTRKGTYRLECTIHPGMEMTLRVR